MRTCTVCGSPKPESEFYRKTKEHLRSDCKDCHKKAMKPRCAQHYAKNKDSYYRRNKERYKRVLTFVRDLRHNKVCMDCGLVHPYWRMEFDHRDAKTKLEDISMIVKLGWSVKRLKEEIDKCDLVCSNCHRDRTHARLEKSSCNSLGEYSE